MFKEENISLPNDSPKEGDLYKRVTIFGRVFELRYGFYDERDRQSPLCEPAVIYPDFIKNPICTESGEPFATMIQDACKCYRGKTHRTSDSTCAECQFFQHGEDWIGICNAPSRKKG